jgi:hypothetical protein
MRGTGKRPEPQPGQKGTALWALNRYREDALTALLDDLVDLENEGLPPDECVGVRRALEKGANRASEIEDGWFRNVLHAFERLVKDYEKWNDPTGTEPATVAERRGHLKTLRRTRQRLATRIRKRTHVLAKSLDLRIVDAQYEALEELIRAIPTKLPKLAKAVARFAAGRGSSPI